MSTIIQKDRLLQLFTPLNEDELILTHFSGEEWVSQPFRFSLGMFSTNYLITPENLLHKPISIKLNVNAEQPRYFNGLITHFSAGTISEGIRHYHAEIRPWLWLLNYTSNCRIFQNKTVIEIAKLIFTELGFTHFDFSYLTQNYSAREFCVQYQETALHFISRLLQEEGIFYFFQHFQNKHLLTLADKNSAFKNCTPDILEYSNGTTKNHCITQWRQLYNFYSGKISHTDFNFETPDLSLLTQNTGNPILSAASSYETFRYPGKHQTIQAGKNSTQQHFDRQQLNYNFIQGESNCVDFTAAGKFTLTNTRTAENNNYALLYVAHYATDSSYLQDTNSNQTYHNLFICIPATTNYRPSLTLAKPLINGTQTAIVVGPEAEEVYTDHYGRIKIQFHWDRLGKTNEESSCWARVAQSWTGNRWGSLLIPRIGQEVVIQFLNGVPDQPLVTGSVYNANNLPPFDLPYQKTISGIKTRSSNNGSLQEANELHFEDKRGQEAIYLHAQKDFTRIIENNENVTLNSGDQITQNKNPCGKPQGIKTISIAHQ